MGNNIKRTAGISAVLAMLSCNAGALIDISLTPNTAWNVGTGGVVDTVNDSPYTLQNNGEAVRINVRGTDTANWRLSGTVGVDSFSMKWNTVSDKLDLNWKSIYPADTSMFPSLGSGVSQPFYLRYLSPRYITSGSGIIQSSLLRFTAISPYIGTWMKKDVNEGNKWDNSPSLVAESDARLHIAYSGSNHLRYAMWDGQSELFYSTVDPIEMYIGEAAVKLALDSEKVPHVFYSGFGVVTRLNYLRYAKKNAADGSWEITDIDSSSGGHAYGVILRGNVRHILYNSNGNSVKHMVFDGTSWGAAEDVVQAEQLRSAAFVLDQNGNPHVMFICGGGDRVGLNYAKKDSVTGQWNVHNISNATELSSPVLMATNSQGEIISIYKDDQKNAIEFAKLSATGAWEFSDVSYNGGDGASLSLDLNGYPNVAYSYPGNEIRYSQWTGAEWLPPVTIDASDYSLQLPSLSFDSSGRPHIVYVGGAEGYLKYAAWQ